MTAFLKGFEYTVCIVPADQENTEQRNFAKIVGKVKGDFIMAAARKGERLEGGNIALFYPKGLFNVKAARDTESTAIKQALQEAADRNSVNICVGLDTNLMEIAGQSENPVEAVRKYRVIEVTGKSPTLS